MDMKKLIEQINTLARKQRAEGLSEQEKLEQQKLRRTYLDIIRSQVKAELDSIDFISPDADNTPTDKNKG